MDRPPDEEREYHRRASSEGLLLNESELVDDVGWESEYNALSEEERAIVDAPADGIRLFAARGRMLREECEHPVLQPGKEMTDENTVKANEPTAAGAEHTAITTRKARIRQQMRERPG